MKEFSGKTWVPRFPGRKTVDALNSPFKERAQNFIDALTAADVIIKISATLRPPERAYLMHFSFQIAMGSIAPNAVPPMDGVDIEWVHPTKASSIQAARDMVNGYGIVKEPSLTSNHIKGFAIDMTLSEFLTKEIKKADGSKLRVAAFKDLIIIGESYQVFHKVPNDLPHWSITGR